MSVLYGKVEAIHMWILGGATLMQHVAKRDHLPRVAKALESQTPFCSGRSANSFSPPFSLSFATLSN